MAKTTGTATSYLQLMTEFRDFLTGLSPTISMTAVRDTSTSPVGASSPDTTEMIFEGDASNGGSPERKWYFGIRSYQDSGSGIFGWGVRGYTGFDDGSPVGSVSFDDQPDPSPEVYVPLQDTSMTYWIWANERRVVMVVKTGTSYQWFHAGFLDTFATETEYPYPLMICGSSFANTYTFAANNIDYSSMIDPAGNSTEAIPASATSVMWVRFTDGTWWPIKNFRTSGTTASALGDRNVWPLASFVTSDWPTDGANAGAVREWRAAFYSSTAGGTPTVLLAQTPGSPDDITPLFPLTIIWNTPSTQLIGEISGVFWCSSTGGLTSEDEIIDNAVSPEQKYLVFKNVHRTDAWQFGAVKDE